MVYFFKRGIFLQLTTPIRKLLKHKSKYTTIAVYFMVYAVDNTTYFRYYTIDMILLAWYTVNSKVISKKGLNEMQWYKLTATSKTGLIKQLQTTYIIAGNKGFEVLSTKLYNLSQDAIFDNYLTTKQIKAKALAILES
jgi:hypothetical protein